MFYNRDRYPKLSPSGITASRCLQLGTPALDDSVPTCTVRREGWWTVYEMAVQNFLMDEGSKGPVWSTF